MKPFTKVSKIEGSATGEHCPLVVIWDDVTDVSQLNGS
jgi:hypothetical protein